MSARSKWTTSYGSHSLDMNAWSHRTHNYCSKSLDMSAGSHWFQSYGSKSIDMRKWSNGIHSSGPHCQFMSTIITGHTSKTLRALIRVQGVIEETAMASRFLIWVKWVSGQTSLSPTAFILYEGGESLDKQLVLLESCQEYRELLVK